jgi:hypothetical protein
MPAHADSRQIYAGRFWPWGPLGTRPPQISNDNHDDDKDDNGANQICIRNILIGSSSPSENSRDQGGVSHVWTLDPTLEFLQSRPDFKLYQCAALVQVGLGLQGWIGDQALLDEHGGRIEKALMLDNFTVLEPPANRNFQT